MGWLERIINVLVLKVAVSDIQLSKTVEGHLVGSVA